VLVAVAGLGAFKLLRKDRNAYQESLRKKTRRQDDGFSPQYENTRGNPPPTGPVSPGAIPITGASGRAITELPLRRAFTLTKCDTC